MDSNFEMSWSAVAKESGSNGSGAGADFMKLENGDNRIRIVSAPARINAHWEKTVDGKNKKVICSGHDCPLCEKGERAVARYQIQVIDRAEPDKIKVLDCGKQVMNAISAYTTDPDYGDPTEYDIKIKKEGSGRDTHYSAVAVPRKVPLTAAEQEMVKNARSLRELNKVPTRDEIFDMGLDILAGDGLEAAVSSADDANDWGSL